MKGIGTDIIEIKRIKELNHRERFIHKLLSNDELNMYINFKSDKRKDEFLAGRWAVKEALYKALGSYCDNKSYKEFISHCENYAVAFVIYE